MELKVTTDGHPILDQFSEEGFIDCVFKIQNLMSDGDYYTFHLSASFAGDEVGMNVRVFHDIRAGFDENMELNSKHVYINGVVFFRSGPESDRLLIALSNLYELQNSATIIMTNSKSFTGIALHQGEINCELVAIKIKLFGNDAETDPAADYNESFFNLDIPNGLVFWNEKDQEYRSALIRSLSITPT